MLTADTITGRLFNNTRLTCITLLVLSFAYYTQPVQAARQPSSKRECATCHIMWLSDFKRTDVETLIPYDPLPEVDVGKTDVVSTQRMCLSCHDGFVLDSRFLWQEGKHTHPVGVKPSDKIKIPIVEEKELFPLNKDGKVYCGTCHTAHGIDWEQSKTAVFMRLSNEEGQLCLACHEDKGEGPKQGSHPIFKKLDDIPPKLIKAGAQFGSDGNVLCQSCHRPHGAAGKKMLLLANERGQLCGACHADRYAEDRATAGRLGTHPINIPMTNASLPKMLKQHGAKLGPGESITCQSCHSPHEAVPNTRILVQANPRAELCMTCHQDQKIVAGGKHDMRLVDAGSKNVRDQTVAAAGVCSACHVPHKGTGPKMWARPVDQGLEPMAALCLSCHRNNGLAEKATVGSHSHPVGAAISRLGHNIDLPAFSREGVKYVNSRQGLVTCASCHNPHRWDPANEQARAKPGSKGKPNNRFLRKVDGPDSQLCRSCHQQQAGIIDSKHDLNLIAPREHNIRNQTLDRSGICGGCHLVHNAEGSFLWARKLIKDSTDTSATCTSCHNPKGLAKKADIGEHSHPLQVDMKKLGITVTAGTWRINLGLSQISTLTPLPLYDSKGRHTDEAGKLGCGSCHDPHNWSPDGIKIPRDEVKKIKGGAGDSFLRFSAAGSSQLCVNCHQDKGAVVNSKHDMTIAEVKNEKTGEPVEKPAGVCLGCHKPHDAKEQLLWARDTGPGKGSVEVLCTACHQADGIAKAKLTGDYSHPVGVKLSAQMKPVELPLFPQHGPNSHDKDRMDCGTCHDPHRWTPGKIGIQTVAEGKREGDARNSFLRLAAAPDSKLCLKCHSEKRWVIGTDHDLRISGPMIPNKDGQQVGKTGVCGQCHVPHNGIDGGMLWARFPGMLWARFPGDDAPNPAEQRCLSCHRSGLTAEGRFPGAIGHPGKVQIWPSADGVIPLYDAGGKPIDSGVIVCSSCHNPHQWNPEQQAEGPGQETEGDVRTSFLRMRHTGSFICSACHGQDSLFRYKYFHSEEAHQGHDLSR